MQIDFSIIAGTISTVIFALSTLPMLMKAVRTKDLRSYSPGNILLANLGNVVHSAYVFSLPAGPIWLLHSFYLVTTGMMLSWYVRYEWLPARKRVSRSIYPVGVPRLGHSLFPLPGYTAHSFDERSKRMATITLSPGLRATRLASRSAIITRTGILCFVALVVTLHFLRPDLNPMSEPTSAYAAGQYSFLMTAAFFSISVASLALVLALYQLVSLSARSRIGLVLLGTWALGVLIAMIFPMDPDGAPPTLSGTIHQTAGPLTFLSLTAGMIFMSWAFQQDAAWRPFFRTSLTLSLLMLAAYIATFLSFATDSGTPGIAQRIALTIAVTWMLLTAARLRSTPSVSAV